MTTPLCEIALKYRTDKCPQILHSYTPVYYELFKDKREIFKKILELGIGCPRTMKGVRDYNIGASLYMWREFFPNAHIYGADVLPETMFQYDRITTYLCNETKKEDLVRLIEEIGGDLDLVVDDADHNWNKQIFACVTLMPLLKRDVIYIIEDAVRPELIVKRLSMFGCRIINPHSTREEGALVVVRNYER